MQRIPILIRARRANGFRRGYTLVEIMVAVFVSALVVTGLLGGYVVCTRYWHRTSAQLSTTTVGSRCLESMVYGEGTSMGLRAAYWVTNLGSATNWSLLSSNVYERIWYTYDRANKRVFYSNALRSVVIATNIVDSQVTFASNGLKIAISVLQYDGPYPDGNKFETFVKPRVPKER
jgi:prepilin-type N-terminal cleavage/methylation domain-containing protein